MQRCSRLSHLAMDQNQNTPLHQQNPSTDIAQANCDPSPPELCSYEKKRDARVAYVRQQAAYLEAKYAAEQLYATVEQERQNRHQRKARQKFQIEPRETIPRSAKVDVCYKEPPLEPLLRQPRHTMKSRSRKSHSNSNQSERTIDDTTTWKDIIADVSMTISTAPVSVHVNAAKRWL
jgi:hypothetical protein